MFFSLAMYGLILTLFIFAIHVFGAVKVDENGYIVFCPCMGRFGNQADHFLGVLSFAHAVNRTLILPPWVEYGFGRPTSIQVPFDRYFLVGPFSDYHRVITMERFMKELAPEIWPPEKRIAFCYGPRHGKEANGCNAKDGNPFGPFWDYSNIDFVGSEFYGGLGDSVDSPSQVNTWKNRYPPEMFPVLAFSGAPASFPVKDSNRWLQKFMKWSSYVESEASKFIKQTLPQGPFVGIHLRNDLDWDNVCQHVGDGSNQLFASPQCLGYRNERGKLTMEICKPSENTVVKQVVKAVKKYKANSVFVAADKDHMLRQLNAALQKIGVKPTA